MASGTGTYSQGPHKLGSTPGPDRDTGTVACMERVKVEATAVATQDVIAYLPAGSTLIDVILDAAVTPTGTTATISGGTTVGGTELWNATDTKATPRTRPIFTTAQVLQMQAMPKVAGQSDSPVHIRLTQTGPTAVGAVAVMLIYTLD